MLQDQARTAGWISTAGFGVGLLASGAFLYFALRAPSSSRAAATARNPALQVLPLVESGRGAAAGSIDLRGTF